MRAARPAALIALTATLLLSACTTLDPPAETVPPITDPALETLRARYEAELALLRRELAELRTEDDAERAIYEARIAALEAALDRLTGSLTDRPDEGTGSIAGSPSDGVGTGRPKPSETENHHEITTNATTQTPRETTDSPWSDPGQSPGEAAFHYRMEEGEAIICAYTGTATTVVIPADIDGHPVTRIADNAFAGTGVTAVTVPASVRHIGWFAFYGCTALEVVTLPGSVEAIDYGAFDVCPRLTLRVPAGSYAEAYAVAYGLAREVLA